MATTVAISPAELRKALGKLAALGDAFPKKKRQALLRKAARPLVAAARSNIHDADHVVKVYKTPKLSGKLRAPKGYGVVLKEYQPGTLRESIKSKTLTRSADIFVGPTSGRGKKYDAFFAHFVEFLWTEGKSFAFMRRALSATKSQVEQNIIDLAAKELADTIKKLQSS